MALAGVPASGLWALIVLVLVVIQLPALLILVPVIIYVFSVSSTTVAVVFTIWSVLVSSSDTFLKPLLLGRGLEIPMIVILLGAIGGMIAFGIVGLFVGAVVLALGYEIFHAWLGEVPVAIAEPSAESNAGS
jgi:predicted PurR-regulated permease PerM